MHFDRRVLFGLVFLVGFAMNGCGKDVETTETPAKETGKPPKETVAPETMAKAREIYQKRCAVCHGETGNSDGPTAATLKPLPAKFTDPTWQLATSDEAIEAIIEKGGSAVDKSLLMPPNLDLSDETIKGLRILVREFAN